MLFILNIKEVAETILDLIKKKLQDRMNVIKVERKLN